MAIQNLSNLLAQVTQIVVRTGVLLSKEWNRADGPHGQGDKTLVDVEIEIF